MLTLTNKAPDPAFPSASSVFFEVVANVFFRNDLIGGQPTTCALPYKYQRSRQFSRLSLQMYKKIKNKKP